MLFNYFINVQYLKKINHPKNLIENNFSLLKLKSYLINTK